MMRESKYVVFRIGKERYGMPISKVERILAAEPITRIPKAPKMMLGIFEMRGETVPVIDGQIRFEVDHLTEGKNFIVTSSSAGRYALRVDTVEGIEDFTDSCTDEPHRILDRSDPFLSGIGRHGDELTALLDPEHVIPQNLKAKVSKIAA